MLDVLQLGLGQGRLGRVPQNVVVEIPLVVDLVDELVHARRGLSIAALERLGADNLAVVDD